jgi:16S rRNA (uracil1498-N3)-methyltransferase
MTIARLFHSQNLASGREICLDDAAARHAVSALRLKKDDAVVLFNGMGGEYPARIIGIVKNGVTVLTGDWQNIEREPLLQILLAQAVSSAEKMNLTVQKAVELGAAVVQPLASQRGVGSTSAAHAQKRVQHWRKVAIAACEQCGRNRIPQIAEMISLKKFLAISGKGMRIMLSPEGGASFKQLEFKDRAIAVLVGAEGGLTSEESRAARDAGFIPVTLGRRVLRTETAGLAALAAIQTLWGDF